jgi:hypothetical protein
MRSLVRWQPFQEFTSLQKQMNHLFEVLSGSTSLMPLEENQGFVGEWAGKEGPRLTAPRPCDP